jgi:hypothetical protein
MLDVRLSAPPTVLGSDLTSVRLCLEGGWCRIRPVPFQPGRPGSATALHVLSFTGALTTGVTGPGSGWPDVLLIVAAFSGSDRVAMASAWGATSSPACHHGNGSGRPVYRVKAWLYGNGTFGAYLPPIPIDPPRAA